MTTDEAEGKKVVWVIGAGSTYSDGQSLSPKHMRPPLDSGFFRNAAKDHEEEVEPLKTYFLDDYGWDILEAEHDSLEKIMVALYTDGLNPKNKKADLNFRKLIRLYNSRLIETTNKLMPTQRRNIYRLLYLYCLRLKTRPNSLTILTFNHDIHIEKNLDLFCQNHSDKHLESFAFPDCYSLGPRPVSILPKPGDSFAISTIRKSKIRILKLHGSYNWYSLYERDELSTSKMFAKNRDIQVFGGLTLEPRMRTKWEDKIWSTFPVIIPPITGKSTIMHPKLHSIWNAAEESLKDCNEIIFFGYSFPPTDTESAQLFRRAVATVDTDLRLSVVDPDVRVLERVSGIVGPRDIMYCPSINSFLKWRAAVGDA